MRALKLSLAVLSLLMGISFAGSSMAEVQNNAKTTFLDLITEQCILGIEEGMKEGLAKSQRQLDKKYIRRFATKVCACSIPKIKDKIFSQDEKAVDAALEAALHQCAQQVIIQEQSG